MISFLIRRMLMEQKPIEVDYRLLNLFGIYQQIDDDIILDHEYTTNEIEELFVSIPEILIDSNSMFTQMIYGFKYLWELLHLQVQMLDQNYDRTLCDPAKTNKKNLNNLIALINSLDCISYFLNVADLNSLENTEPIAKKFIINLIRLIKLVKEFYQTKADSLGT